MTRSEALAPLRDGEGRFNITAGMAIRGEIRRGAVSFGVDFYEEKGFFESAFVFRGSKERLLKFMRVLKQNFAD